METRPVPSQNPNCNALPQSLGFAILLVDSANYIRLYLTLLRVLCKLHRRTETDDDFVQLEYVDGEPTHRNEHTAISLQELHKQNKQNPSINQN